MFKRMMIFIYGLISYGIGFATLLYIIGFVGNVLVPRSIDGDPQMGTGTALAIDLGLVLIFGIQHSVMARPRFKKWLTKFIPEAAERSTYVLASALALAPLFAFWQPLGGTVWNINVEEARIVAYSIFGLGWVILFYSTFLIDHFELFGLRQVTVQLMGKNFERPKFRVPQLYKHVRHPIYVGWILGFWAAPTMSVTHLLFALSTTVYILIAIRYEERDLIAVHGASYANYRQAVPMLLPSLKPATVD